ncbi:MAG: hypothetical protein ABI852_11800 [Gemmatimonadaceae bacterium]
MNDILQQTLTVQTMVLLVLSAVVACVAWTVTHEEVFREPREFCVKKSKTSKSLLVRKFFYLFTCEYCFSHYVSAGIVLGTSYRVLMPDWRGAIVAWLTLVWIANFQMSAFARIRLEVKLDRIEIDEKTDENGDAKGGTDKAATPVKKEPRL